jgi:DNA-binding NarL/FixJ family response regulator
MFDPDIDVFPMRAGPPKAEGRHSYRLPKDSLSSRETEICKLLTKGMRLKEVALQLSISIHTAGRHAQNAYLKLGVHDRGELVRHFALPNVIAVPDTLTGSMSPTHTKGLKYRSKLNDLVQGLISVPRG